MKIYPGSKNQKLNRGVDCLNNPQIFQDTSRFLIGGTMIKFLLIYALFIIIVGWLRHKAMYGR